jgi:hypothetical protein
VFARIKRAAPFAALAFAVLVNAYGYHACFHAYVEERDHAEWLYGCTQFQRPEPCENDWQRQYAHTAPPWGF